ncbi:hypothetical protein [Kitasatospora sp. NPDC050463]|uniref:hypothetical protein n=1 Tax=Kitasatospora sp. NPDC050463 TaxID=3155786 RepID=UPI0033E3DD2F
MPQNYEDYPAEVAEAVELDVEAVEADEGDEYDEYDELAERRALGADPATEVADVVEQSRVVELDEDEYREAAEDENRE